MNEQFAAVCLGLLLTMMAYLISRTWLDQEIQAGRSGAGVASPDQAARVDDGLEYEYHVHPEGWILVLAREPREPHWED